MSLVWLLVFGDTVHDRVEVLAGLGEGDLVVTRPSAAMTDGTRVTEAR